VARKSKNLNEPAVQEIDGPAGLDLNPSPPEAVRVSKRAALAVLLVLCCLASVFGYGVYQRQHQAMNAAFSANDPQNLVPATAAAKEITKDIPAGVINLATDADVTTTPQSGRNGRTPEPAGPSATKVASAPTAARNQGPSQPPQNTQPTPEQRRIAEAYGRELQAIAAPTVIRSNVAGGPMRQYDSTAAPASDSSPLAALAQLLTPKTGTATDSTSHRVTDREYEEQNMQAQKEAFLAQARKSGASGYLPSTRVQPLSDYEIKAGWEIPAVLEQELNSDLPGELKALVTANVYDTATGRYLLIPQGARLVGTYDSNVAYGQNGLQVVWHRVIYPDSSSVDLGGMTGQDARGSSGFRGDVDNHYKRLIGFAALTSLFSAGFQLSQPNRSNILQNPSAGEIAAGAVGQEISQLGSQITRRNLNIQPTIKIPVGYKFNVRVNRDILFEGPYPGGSLDR